MQTIAERAPEQVEPASSRFVTGVRICRLILGVAATALVAWAIDASKPFYAALALGCVLAIVVKNRNVRSILASIAAVEAMYFVADTISPEGGSVLRNLIVALCGVVVFMAIMRLRHWESSTKHGFNRRFHWAAAMIGLLLIINTGLVISSPTNSSQWSGSATKSACGSILKERTLPAAWEGVRTTQIAYDCSNARRDRLAYTILLFEVGVGAIFIGREFVRSRSRVALVAALTIIAGFAGGAWSNASYSNANAHDVAFSPWINKYDGMFNELSTVNISLKAALKTGNSNEVATACTQLQAVDDALAPSVAEWPSQDNAGREIWQRFLTQHRADAVNCVKSASATSSGEDLRSSDWFSDSSATINKLRNTLNYQ